MAAFVSPDLDAFGRLLGLPLVVIAVTSDPASHLIGMTRRQHACWCLREDWVFTGVGGEELDPLMPTFRQLPLDPRWMGRRRLSAGVAIESGSLLTSLPDAGSRARFEAELGVLLRPKRFDVFGARPGCVLRRRATGRPPVVAPRYSQRRGAGDGSTAFEVVDDLYAFRPKDLPALAAAVTTARDRATALDSLVALVRGARQA